MDLTLNTRDEAGHTVLAVSGEVDVYTASPISSGELDVIRDRLKRALGKEPIVHPYTDGAMIGGLKLQIGDQLIDASIATSLRKLRDLGKDAPFERRRLPMNEFAGVLRGRYPELRASITKAVDRYAVLQARGEA